MIMCDKSLSQVCILSKQYIYILKLRYRGATTHNPMGYQFLLMPAVYF